ncbi:MAG: hypothetical protein U0744_10995 [Gemmataceae bacterium]
MSGIANATDDPIVLTWARSADFQVCGNCRSPSSHEDAEMIAVRQQRAKIYVDRASQQWVVLDPDGNFWSLPSVEHPWDQRLPFFPTEGTELESIPGHYKHVLRLPF